MPVILLMPNLPDKTELDYFSSLDRLLSIEGMDVQGDTSKKGTLYENAYEVADYTNNFLAFKDHLKVLSAKGGTKAFLIADHSPLMQRLNQVLPAVETGLPYGVYYLEAKAKGLPHPVIHAIAGGTVELIIGKTAERFKLGKVYQALTACEIIASAEHELKALYSDSKLAKGLITAGAITGQAYGGAKQLVIKPVEMQLLLQYKMLSFALQNKFMVGLANGLDQEMLDLVPLYKPYCEFWDRLLAPKNNAVEEQPLGDAAPHKRPDRRLQQYSALNAETDVNIFDEIFKRDGVSTASYGRRYAQYLQHPQAAQWAEQMFKPKTGMVYWLEKLREVDANFKFQGSLSNLEVTASIGSACEGFDSLPWNSPNFGTPVGLAAKYHELWMEGMQYLHKFMLPYLTRLNIEAAKIDAFKDKLNQLELSRFNDDAVTYVQIYNKTLKEIEQLASDCAQLKQEVGDALKHRKEGVKKKIHKMVWRDEFRKWAVDVYEVQYSDKHRDRISGLRKLITPDQAEFNAACRLLNRGQVLSDDDILKVLGYSLHHLKIGMPASNDIVQGLQQLWQTFTTLDNLTDEQYQLLSLTAKGLALLNPSNWPADYRAMRILEAYRKDAEANNPYLRQLSEYHNDSNAAELKAIGEGMLREIIVSKRSDLLENEEVIKLFGICSQYLADGAIYTDMMMVRFYNTQDWQQISDLFRGRYSDPEPMVDATLREKLFFVLAQYAIDGEQLGDAKLLVRNACGNLEEGVFNAATDMPLLQNYVTHLLEDGQFMLDDIVLLKRGFASSEDEQMAGFWLRHLYNAYLVTGQLTEAEVLLADWAEKYPKATNIDEMKLQLVQAQFVNNDYNSAQETFATIKQPRLQDAVELSGMDDVSENVKPTVFGELVFNANPDSVLAFSLYLKGLMDANTDIDVNMVNAAFRRFSNQKLEDLSDDELSIYHQYVTIFNQLNLLESDIPLSDCQELKSRFTQSLNVLENLLALDAPDKQLVQAQHALEILALLYDYVDGGDALHSISDTQILKFAANLEILLKDKRFTQEGVEAPHSAVYAKALSCNDHLPPGLAKLKQVRQEINGNLELLTRFPKMRMAKFRMDGVEALQFLLPFFGPALGMSQIDLYKADNLLEIFSRVFQWQFSVPNMGTKVDPRDPFTQTLYLLMAGGLRVRRNNISIQNLRLKGRQHRQILANNWRINYLSTVILALDSYNVRHTAKVVPNAEITWLQKLSLSYQFFSTLSGYFAAWEHEKSFTKNKKRLTLLGLVYDLSKAVSFAVGRNPYMKAVFYGSMTANVVEFFSTLGVEAVGLTGKLMVKSGVPVLIASAKASLLKNPQVVRIVNAEITKKMLSYTSAAAAGSAPALKWASGKAEKYLLKVGFEKTAEGGLKMGATLAKGVSVALLASVVYDVASILGFGWESEQLQNIANLIREEKYDDAKKLLKEFDESYGYYNFHRIRTGIANWTYGLVLGGDSHKVQEYRLNKIYILRELLAASIDLHEGKQDKVINVLEKMLKLASFYEIINHKSPDAMLGKIYEFFTGSHYDTYVEDGFAIPIISISSSAYLKAKMGRCDAEICELEPEDWLERIQKLDFENDQVAEEVFGKWAYYFMNDIACLASGLSIQCDVAMNRYFGMRDLVPVVDSKVTEKMNAIDSGVVMSRVHHAYRDFLSQECDLSTACEQRQARLDEIVRGSQIHLVDDRHHDNIAKLEDQAALHRVSGTLTDFQKRSCDLTLQSIDRASTLEQRVNAVKISHYLYSSDIRHAVENTSSNCFHQAVLAYKELGKCEGFSLECDTGLSALEQIFEKLPIYTNALRDKLSEYIQGLYLNRLNHLHRKIYESCEKSAKCSTELPNVSDFAANAARVLKSSPYADEVRKFSYASNQYAVNALVKQFRSYQSDLTHSLDTEFAEYQRIRQTMDVVANEVNDELYQQYQDRLKCSDELVAIHRGQLSSLENNYSCPESMAWFDIKRTLFIGNATDLVIRLVLESAPIAFKMISYVPLLKRFSVNTNESKHYKRFDTLLSLLRESILYGVAYHLSHYTPTISPDVNVQSMGAFQLLLMSSAQLFTQHQALLRISSLVFNWVLTEKLDVRLKFSRNKIFKPLIAISTVMFSYYAYGLMNQLIASLDSEKNEKPQLATIFYLYIVVMQLVNLSSLLLHYQQYNHADRYVSRWGGLSLHLYRLQSSLFLKCFGFAFLLSSMGARLPEYSSALNFYQPIRQICLSTLELNSMLQAFVLNWIPFAAIRDSLLASSTLNTAMTGLSYLVFIYLFASVVGQVYNRADFKAKKYRELKLNFAKEGDAHNCATRAVLVKILSGGDFAEPEAMTVDTPNFPSEQRAADSEKETVSLSTIDSYADVNTTANNEPASSDFSFSNLWSGFTGMFAQRNLAMDATTKVAARPVVTARL